MTTFANEFMHPLDKKALTILRAFPGFELLTSLFIAWFHETPGKIFSMAECLRVSPTQYSQLYNLLTPICRKLNIQVPELYVELNRSPNACTFGDKHPIIIITSGLLESMNTDEISVVLAHECGHIACHHVLYHTIGSYLLNQLGCFLSIPFPVSTGLYYAMQYWMRCSELSADRASAICAGGSEKVIQVMMNFSGGSQLNNADIHVSEYLKQAKEYQQYINSSIWRKLANTIQVSSQTHPFNATRAVEIDKWCHSEQFQKIQNSHCKGGMLS